MLKSKFRPCTSIRPKIPEPVTYFQFSFKFLLRISQSKCYGTRKFTLRYQLFGMNFDFEVSRVDCNFLKEKQKVSTLNILMLNITFFLVSNFQRECHVKGSIKMGLFLHTTNCPFYFFICKLYVSDLPGFI